MVEAIRVSAVLPAMSQRVYAAWLSGKEHSAFTSSKATVRAVAGGKHTAWDGYIWGKTLEMSPYTRIVQSWRTTEFPEDAEDSRLEVRLAPVKGGTRITLVHTNIPDGQGAQYREGWREHYFAPMKAYFAIRAKG